MHDRAGCRSFSEVRAHLVVPPGFIASGGTVASCGATSVEVAASVGDSPPFGSAPVSSGNVAQPMQQTADRLHNKGKYCIGMDLRIGNKRVESDRKRSLGNPKRERGTPPSPPVTISRGLQPVPSVPFPSPPTTNGASLEAPFVRSNNSWLPRLTGGRCRARRSSPTASSGPTRRFRRDDFFAGISRLWRWRPVGTVRTPTAHAVVLQGQSRQCSHDRAGPVGGEVPVVAMAGLCLGLHDRAVVVCPETSTCRFVASPEFRMRTNSRSIGSAPARTSSLPNSNRMSVLNLLTPVSGSNSKSGYLRASSSNARVVVARQRRMTDVRNLRLQRRAFGQQVVDPLLQRVAGRVEVGDLLLQALILPLGRGDGLVLLGRQHLVLFVELARPGLGHRQLAAGTTLHPVPTNVSPSKRVTATRRRIPERDAAERIVGTVTRAGMGSRNGIGSSCVGRAVARRANVPEGPPVQVPRRDGARRTSESIRAMRGVLAGDVSVVRNREGTRTVRATRDDGECRRRYELVGANTRSERSNRLCDGTVREGKHGGESGPARGESADAAELAERGEIYGNSRSVPRGIPQVFGARARHALDRPRGGRSAASSKVSRHSRKTPSGLEDTSTRKKARIAAHVPQSVCLHDARIQSRPGVNTVSARLPRPAVGTIFRSPRGGIGVPSGTVRVYLVSCGGRPFRSLGMSTPPLCEGDIHRQNPVHTRL